MQSKLEGLSTTNALMKEDLSIGRTALSKSQEENRRLILQIERLEVKIEKKKNWFSSPLLSIPKVPLHFTESSSSSRQQQSERSAAVSKSQGKFSKQWHHYHYYHLASRLSISYKAKVCGRSQKARGLTKRTGIAGMVPEKSQIIQRLFPIWKTLLCRKVWKPKWKWPWNYWKRMFMRSKIQLSHCETN